MLYHTDVLKQLFPSTATLKRVVDGGLFFDVQDYNSYRSKENVAVDDRGENSNDGAATHYGHTFRQQYDVHVNHTVVDVTSFIHSHT